MTSTRQRVLALYKELHRLGRDYPDPSYDFNGRMRRMFESLSCHRLRRILLGSQGLGRLGVVLENRALTDPAEIEQALRFGEYIRNETLALYSLRKYRHLKQRYDSPKS